MARCRECRRTWREMEDEAPTECPFCGYTGREHDEEGPDEEEDEEEEDPGEEEEDGE